MIPMFYKRKLAKFNFTVYVLGKKKGIVNFVMKHEVTGGFMRSPPAWKHSWLSYTRERIICLCTETTARAKIIVYDSLHVTYRNIILKHGSLEWIEMEFTDLLKTGYDSLHSTVDTALQHTVLFTQKTNIIEWLWQSRILSQDTNKTDSVVWSGNIDVDKERRTSSANFWKENI
jgi:hypothetical protein